MKKIAALVCLLLIASVRLWAQPTQWNLSGRTPLGEWQLIATANVDANGFQLSKAGYQLTNYVKGSVPGTVFGAYIEAGLLPDPNYSDHIYRVDETLFNQPFWYRTELELPEKIRRNERVWLHFDNTNRYADVYLNGTKLSGTDSSTRDISGHMIRSKFDVTDLVQPDSKNAIAVLITDADQKKRRDSKESFGVAASPTYLSAASWDWMPYVPGRLAGITGNAYLRKTGEVILEDPWVRSQLESNDIAYLSVSTQLRNSSGEQKEVSVSGVIQPGNIRFTKKVQLAPHSSTRLYIDRKDVEDLVIHEPKLWWPNGYGDPNLYTCELSCEINEQVSDRHELTFGIRRYDYRFVENAAGWPVMTFFINGKQLFLKGGNWGMSEYLLRCREEDYEEKIRLHKDMNFNMIRLWTGCVTDDAFYDYCDRYGIMVWDDFWLYVAYNEVEEKDAFKKNALDKVRRLRNHPSIALWCGANETHPEPELDDYLRSIVASEDHNDRMYKSSSNQDGLSGSGWWGNQPPKHHFETSGSNLAWNKPPYPYGPDRGYGLRTEIGTATFPTFESVKEFIPEADWWPLPSDTQLKEDEANVWNKHYFGKEASNANPVEYKSAVNRQFGESGSLDEFCSKAQFLNIEVMKGMFEAWNDKMWNDATGLLIWMSQSAYPSFVWQTYDYYHDATGAYRGAKKACEPLHIQWNSSSNGIRVINTSSQNLTGASAKASVYNLDGSLAKGVGKTAVINVPSSDTRQAFELDFPNSAELSELHFIRLELRSAEGELLSENFYWRNGAEDLNYQALNGLAQADLKCSLEGQQTQEGKSIFQIKVENRGGGPAFGNRLRLVERQSGRRLLPIIASDNYFTLMPGESKTISIELASGQTSAPIDLLIKQYTHQEQKMLEL